MNQQRRLRDAKPPGPVTQRPGHLHLGQVRPPRWELSMKVTAAGSCIARRRVTREAPSSVALAWDHGTRVFPELPTHAGADGPRAQARCSTRPAAGLRGRRPTARTPCCAQAHPCGLRGLQRRGALPARTHTSAPAKSGTSPIAAPGNAAPQRCGPANPTPGLPGRPEGPSQCPRSPPAVPLFVTAPASGTRDRATIIT